MGGVCSTHGKDKNPEGKRASGRNKLRWEHIGIILTETGWLGVDFIYSAQNRDQWKALENTKLTLGLRKRQEIL